MMARRSLLRFSCLAGFSVLYTWRRMYLIFERHVSPRRRSRQDIAIGGRRAPAIAPDAALRRGGNSGLCSAKQTCRVLAPHCFLAVGAIDADRGPLPTTRGI
jgi:hypothetical protein